MRVLGSVFAFAATVLLSFATAWILAVTIETPCIRLGRAWSKVWSAERPQELPSLGVPTPAAA